MFGGRRKPLLDCRRLTLGPDDILVLKARDPMSQLSLAQVREAVGRVGVPQDRILIVDGTMSVSVLAR
jgi:hypothetical protein